MTSHGWGTCDEGCATRRQGDRRCRCACALNAKILRLSSSFSASKHDRVRRTKANGDAKRDAAMALFAPASASKDEGRPRRRPANATQGLTNEGATCYVNCVVQVAMRIDEFRSAVYETRAKADAASGDDATSGGGFEAGEAVRALASVFARCAKGNARVGTCEDFVRALGVEPGVHQDASEFFTLLTEHVERGLGRELMTMKGSSRYATTCLRCGVESEASAATHRWTAVDVSVNASTCATLQSSVESSLASETLEGENAYACESCAPDKTEARRGVRFEAPLPETMIFQLQRFVFDFEDLVRKKVTDAFSFPATIENAYALLNVDFDDDGDVERRYELCSIVLHKGASATVGHYVALCRDTSGSWWRYDDDVVEELEAGPFSAVKIERDTENEQDNTLRTSSNAKKRKTTAVIGRDGAEYPETGTLCSKDVYLLVYRRAGVRAANFDEDQLPAEVQRHVEQMNLEFETSVKENERILESNTNQIKQRREEVVEFLNRCMDEKQERVLPSERMFWLPFDWYKSYLGDVEPPAYVDAYRQMRCEHHLLDPVFARAECVPIPENAWRYFAECRGADPMKFGFSDSDICPTCVDAIAIQHDWKVKDERERHEMQQLYESWKEAKAGDDVHRKCLAKGDARHVHTMFFNKWVKWCDSSVKFVWGQGPTSPIECPHERLRPNVSTTLIPFEVWSYLLKSAPADLRIPDFPNDTTSSCEMCRIAKDEHSRDVQAQQEEAKRFREVLPHVATREPAVVKVGASYAAVSVKLLEEWREYIADALKKSNVLRDRPVMDFGAANSCLFCCHERLMMPLPDIVWARGEWRMGKLDELNAQKPYAYELHHFDEVHTFLKLIADGVTMEDMDLLKLEMLSTVQAIDGDVEQKSHWSAKSTKPRFWPSDVVCVPCAETARYTFDSATIYIEQVYKIPSSSRAIRVNSELDESLDSTLTTPIIQQTSSGRRTMVPSSRPAPDTNMKSTRRRGTKLTLSSSITVGKLKVRILEKFNISPFDQKLFLPDGTPMDDDFGDLASYCVQPDDTITLFSTDIHDPEDASYFDEILLTNVSKEDAAFPSRLIRRVESDAGFAGTALQVPRRVEQNDTT